MLTDEALLVLDIDAALATGAIPLIAKNTPQTSDAFCKLRFIIKLHFLIKSLTLL